MNNKETVSAPRKQYLKKLRQNKRRIFFTRIIIIIGFFGIWEISADIGIIDSFVFSSPSRIIATLLNLTDNGLLHHMWVTLYETLTGFTVGVLLGILIATLLWWSPFLSRVFEPILVVLNSLPKIALGPVIIIWVGAGVGAIIFMAIAISLIVTVLELLNGFRSTDRLLVKMAETFCANRSQIFFKIIFPSNLHTLFNSLKINIGLSLVGVIAGEFLVSKAGLGYLIVYGGQVFQLDLVMASVIILALMATLLYQGVIWLERLVLKTKNHN